MSSHVRWWQHCRQPNAFAAGFARRWKTTSVADLIWFPCGVLHGRCGVMIYGWHGTEWYRFGCDTCIQSLPHSFRNRRHVFFLRGRVVVLLLSTWLASVVVSSRRRRPVVVVASSSRRRRRVKSSSSCRRRSAVVSSSDHRSDCHIHPSWFLPPH